MSRATQRIQTEIRRFLQDPPENVPRLAIKNDDLSKIYFLIVGPVETPYKGGEYVVEVTLPPGYPMKPPELRMMTPSGRFAPGSLICTSFANFHPETWTPSYSLTSILVSLLSFMTEESPGSVGSIQVSDAERRTMAKESKTFNRKHGYDALFEAQEKPGDAT
jgi:ubiquitin-conjugating enzyme E2 J2